MDKIKYFFIKTNHNIAAIILVAIATYFGHGYEMAIGITAFFIGREEAQAEERYINRFANRKRANAPWYCGFIPKAWNLDSLVLDMILPSILAFGTFYVLKTF
jgi:hypothetical protein